MQDLAGPSLGALCLLRRVSQRSEGEGEGRGSWQVPPGEQKSAWRQSQSCGYPGEARGRVTLPTCVGGVVRGKPSREASENRYEVWGKTEMIL